MEQAMESPHAMDGCDCRALVGKAFFAFVHVLTDLPLQQARPEPPPRAGPAVAAPRADGAEVPSERRRPR